ncbi:MAG: hypothetical protein IK102_02975 [Treponema sp.]|nr:hypothetical protein [Treponema sp.]
MPLYPKAAIKEGILVQLFEDLLPVVSVGFSGRAGDRHDTDSKNSF